MKQSIMPPKNISIETARRLYAAARRIAVAEAGFESNAVFDDHVGFIVRQTIDSGMARACRQTPHFVWADVAIQILHSALAKPIWLVSPETLEWGGFLSGDIVHDTRRADAAAKEVLALA